jgi:hypothetical protein
MSAISTGETPAAGRQPAVPAELTRVIATSVVRATDQGESHGGVYLIDLRTGASEQVIDWNDPTISWEGRGADRGLRGIAFHDGHVYLAASDEIFVYDPAFRRVDSFTNRYLRHCHEIAVADGRLYATATGFDSILVRDLATGRWTDGYALRYGRMRTAARRIGRHPAPGFRRFAPEAPGGPTPGDTTHLNSVWVTEGTVYASGTRLGMVVAIDRTRARRHAPIPYHTHNARPFEGGTLFNHTGGDRVCVAGPDGSVRETYRIPRHDPEALEHRMGEDKARQAFGRGLVAVGNTHLIAGSSPATVALYRRGTPDPVATVTLTMDVRNAVHGLELWPYDAG